MNLVLMHLRRRHWTTYKKRVEKTTLINGEEKFNAGKNCYKNFKNEKV